MITVGSVLGLLAVLAAPAPKRMAIVPAGTYTPMYGAAQRVAAFALDREPVTRGEFLEFTRTHSEWRRGTVKNEYADETYLRDWRSGDDARTPAVEISWFAASAYCAAQGKRLPTTAEWERAAAASATRGDARNDSAFRQRILASYATRPASGIVGKTRPNVFGISDLHELVWEWTSDFDGPHADHHMHGHSDMPASCASAAIGASDATNYPEFLRIAVRQSLTRRASTSQLGFRCAMNLA